MGYISFFENFIQIVVLLFAWIVVQLAFFILAVQLFITLIEFKLTTLAGFVLIPFGLFSKTAFLAERAGNVVSSGVKVLVLAVIVGIGSTLFSQFTSGAGAQPSIEDAMALVLASLALLGLGIFGPGIANGIVSGGPHWAPVRPWEPGWRPAALPPQAAPLRRAARVRWPCRGRGRPRRCGRGRRRGDCLSRRWSVRVTMAGASAASSPLRRASESVFQAASKPAGALLPAVPRPALRRLRRTRRLPGRGG